MSTPPPEQLSECAKQWLWLADQAILRGHTPRHAFTDPLVSLIPGDQEPASPALLDSARQVVGRPLQNGGVAPVNVAQVRSALKQWAARRL